MAENKKSFVLYADLIHTLRKIPDAEAGILFKHILSYINDENPVTDNILVEVAFEPIKQQLKRDLIKWDSFRQKQSENGKLGGRPKKEESEINPNNPSLNLESQKSLNVNANVSVNVNDDVINKIIASPFDLAFNDFLEMRKKIKKPATEKAIELLKNKLEKIAPKNSEIQIKILEQSILNNWQDVYELKNNTQNGKATIGSGNIATGRQDFGKL